MIINQFVFRFRLLLQTYLSSRKTYIDKVAMEAEPEGAGDSVKSGAGGILMCLQTEPTNKSGMVNTTMMLKRASKAPKHHRPSLPTVNRQSQWWHYSL